jgi:hypothetical protein
MIDTITTYYDGKWVTFTADNYINVILKRDELEADNAQLEIYLKDERDKSRELEAELVKAKTTINSLLPVTMSLCPVCEKYGITGKQNICDKCTIVLMEAEIQKLQWISVVEDGLPVEPTNIEGELISVTANLGHLGTMWLFPGTNWRESFRRMKYTHWRYVTLPTDIEKGNDD